jgi:ketosteroid isomerase-like protein
MRKLAFAAMVFMFLGGALAQETGWSQAQAEVWGREEGYWKSLQAHDKEAYLALWDEVFLGWPSYAKSPVGKNTLRERPLRAVDSYTFEQKSVQMFGDLAMTFLQVRVKPSSNGKERELVLRITHTWRKKDGEWRIIGGMSCNVNSEGTC